MKLDIHEVSFGNPTGTSTNGSNQPLKAPNKNCSRGHFNFLFELSKKITLDFSCDSLEISSFIFSEKQ